MKLNVPTLTPIDRLAGGAGAPAAKQDPFSLLLRATCACLLWENRAYESGDAGALNIATLVPQCDPHRVAELAVELRTKQGLRHVPLLLMRELARHQRSRHLLGEFLPKVIQRADEISEFLAIYWKDDPVDKKQPIAHQVKVGLGRALRKFDAYQLAKYKGSKNNTVGLKDVMFLVHAHPTGEKTEQKKDRYWRQATPDTELVGQLNPKEIMYHQLANGTLPVPLTRETMLSASTSTEEQRKGFEDMLANRKLGVIAMLKSLRKMTEVGVKEGLVRESLLTARPDRLLPLDFVSAFHAAPQYGKELSVLMQKCMEKFTRLEGRSVFVIDVSGSMNQDISSKSEFNRIDAAVALAIMVSGMCEHVDIYLTAGISSHKTVLYTGPRGLEMLQGVRERVPALGGGGIYTAQMLNFLRKEDGGKYEGAPARIVVFSDSQDCDRAYPAPIPSPFGHKNYIVDVSSHKNGINYEGVWTAEIAGWSQNLLEYIAQYEALSD